MSLSSSRVDVIEHTMASPSSLDYAHWKHVLDYLSVGEIVTMTQVCRHLHDIAQQYLQEDLRLRIETITNIWDADGEPRDRRTITLKVRDDYFLDEDICNQAYFNTVCRKWGRSVLEVVYDAKYADEDILSTLGKECPNLQDITFVRLNWQSPLRDWAANFSKLKRVSFENSSITDACVSELIKKNKSIEALEFRMTYSVTGQFFSNGRVFETGIYFSPGCAYPDENIYPVELEKPNEDYLTKLHTLIIDNCFEFDLTYLLVAVAENCLPRLENLTLDGVKLVLENKDIIADVVRQAALLQPSIQTDFQSIPCPVYSPLHQGYPEDELEFYYSLLHFGPPYKGDAI